MRVRKDGPESGGDAVLVLGWGNKLDHENVRWLSEQVAAAGYRTHTIQIPEVVTDFEREYVAPVRNYVDDFGDFRLIGHSTGGLIGPFLDGATTETYLSPWWGFPTGIVGLDELALSLLAKLPTARPVIPTGEAEKDEIGSLATDRQLAEGPTKAAPTFFREAMWAHDNRPPIDEDAVVFCTLEDPIVSVRAIGNAVAQEQLVIYEGGHEWFSSPAREEQTERFRAAVADGVNGI